jgi:Cu(I)/Ag(I) efflux system membrane fusion protein
MPPDSTPPRPQGLGGKLWLILKVVQARLRFVAVLVAIGALIAYWGTLKAYYEKWDRARHPPRASQTASANVEYYCSMHPQIVRDDPNEKCPICFMPLSRRKKSESPEEALPPGIVSRVQLTPYRVALAGVQTTEAQLQPLTKELTTVGYVEFDERRLSRIAVRLPGRSRIEKLHVNVTGQTVQKGEELALLYNPDLVSTVQNLLDAQRSDRRELVRDARERLRLWGIADDQIDHILQTGQPITPLTIRSPISGHVIRKYQVEGEYVEEGARLHDVADLSMVWIQAQVYEDELAFLKRGMAVSATTLAFPNREFAGRLSFLHPHLDQTTRTLTVRFDMDNPDHELRPGMYATVKLHVPAGQLDLLPADASAAQKQALEQNQVLAVPESAVIDTGARKIVYRQAGPTLFEGVEVRLGPRMVGPQEVVYYPVLHGLEPGVRVVTVGSFLIDAETRLNPAAGSIYYSGSGSGQRSAATVAPVRPSTPTDPEEEIRAALYRLAPEDRLAAEAQKFCPVLQTSLLGSMGTPIKVMLRGHAAFLCCKGCKKEAEEHPAETLTNLAKIKAGGQAARAASAEAAKRKAALDQLDAPARALAEAQKYCPITGELLGDMGTPIPVQLEGQTVFLCCKGCKDQAQADPTQTLTRVRQLQERAKSEH